MESLKQTPHKRIITELMLTLSFAVLFSTTFVFQSIAQSLNSGNQHKPLSTLLAKVQQIYASQIGIREKQPNSGQAVEQYLRYVNLPKGNPWCAAFVCWVYGKAGIVNPRSGWSPDLFGVGRIIWARRAENGKLKTENADQHAYVSSLATGNWQPAYRSGRRATPGTGDIFGLFFPEKRRIAHVGFIDQWDGTWVVTVEGNTNVSGSREGDGVYRKRRLVRSVYKVARYIW